MKRLTRYVVVIATLCVGVAGYAQCTTALTASVTASCTGLPTGTATIHASGPTSPYDFRLGVNGSWQPDSLFTGLSAGSDTIYVRGTGGCIDSIIVSMTASGSPFTPSVTASAYTTTFCSGLGLVDTFWATGGGSAALTYQWYRNGTSIPGATSPVYTTSVLSSQDSLWVVGYTHSPCATVDSAVSNIIHITAYTGIVPFVSATASSLSYCAGIPFVDTFWASGSGGSAALTYRWYRNGTAVSGATNPTWSTSSLSDNDSVWVVVHSAAPCAIPDSARSNIMHIHVLSDTLPPIGVAAYSLSYCSGMSFVDTFWATGGTSAALTYQWYRNGVPAATGSSWSTGALTNNDSIWVVAYGTTGCTLGDSTVSAPVVVSILSCGPDTVWPGDADANHIADNTDLLPLGLAYGATGPVRVVQGIVWQGDSVDPWSQNFSIYAPAVNYAHADCNGDGVVNADDTLAIVTNFGLTHPKTDGSAEARSGVPALNLEFSRDTVYNGQSLVAAFILGSANEQLSHIYGIAFTYHYDPLVYDPNSISFEFINSWLGNYTNSINIQKKFLGPGVIKTAITGIDHLDRSGWGAIARFRGTITTDNINGVISYVNHDYVSDIVAVDMKGDTIDVSVSRDSDIIMIIPTGFNDISATGQVSIYPNPASDHVLVSAEQSIQQVRLYDAIGALVLDTGAPGSMSQMLDVSGLANGVYTIQVATISGTATRKLTIRH